ncbi:MAG: L-arabinose isomerase [Verrucomicrobiae bacterium]|nr:L-arabinose isomerase [Verrucomicrobiae bacterium]
MKRNPKIGLLPLYLKLYDDTLPECRAGFDPLLVAVEKGLSARGGTVLAAQVCRVAAEVTAAVGWFEKQDVDCVVTLHLAYSPSLESAPILAKMKRPLIVLDTTLDADFGRDVDPKKIMYNHGVHGVMDLASVLRRLGRQFEVVAGHLTESNALERVARLAEAAVAARRFRGGKVLRIGPSFKGMGDFAVANEVMRSAFGVTVVQGSAQELAAAIKTVKPAEVEAEMAEDRQRYDIQVKDDLHRKATQAGLGLRKLLGRADYTGFSVNFLILDKPTSPAMPFAEISKAMERGVGFGGEGDILTANLMGALATGFGETTFTEIFCSDWHGGSLFLSHMGEIGLATVAGKPRMAVRDFGFLGCHTTALVGAIRPGPAVYVNLVPGPKNSFDLIVSPVEMLGDTTREDMKNTVRGWMQPRLGATKFLEEYSRHGGTHHAALVLGERTEELAAFARFAGIGLVTI